MIKLLTTYKKPKTSDYDINHYFTQRFRKRMVVQAKIGEIKNTYDEDDIYNCNPHIHIDLLNVRNSKDGEMIRNYCGHYLNSEEVNIVLNTGDYIEYSVMVSVYSKIDDISNASSFVKDVLPNTMVYFNDPKNMKRIGKNNVKHIQKGVLSNDKIFNR